MRFFICFVWGLFVCFVDFFFCLLAWKRICLQNTSKEAKSMEGAALRQGTPVTASLPEGPRAAFQPETLRFCCNHWSQAFTTPCLPAARANISARHCQALNTPSSSPSCCAKLYPLCISGSLSKQEFHSRELLCQQQCLSSLPQTQFLEAKQVSVNPVQL